MKILTKNRLEGLNIYLDAGNERGRLASKATVYYGRVGYFFIRTEACDGKQAERIVFSNFDEDDLVVSDFFPSMRLTGIPRIEFMTSDR